MSFINPGETAYAGGRKMDLTTLLSPRQYRFYYDRLSKEDASVYQALLSGMMQYQEKITCIGCSVAQIQQIYNWLKLDIPELFFVKQVRIHYLKGATQHCIVTPEYRFTIQQARDTLIYMADRCKVLCEKYGNSNDLQKEKAIHDYIASTVKYRDIDAPYSHEAPGSIIYSIGVCEGIAKAFKYLSDQLGLKALVVFGFSYENGHENGHAWNLVNVNGTFYHLDTTFDTTISSSCIRYDYFNLSDADMRVSHQWDESLPSCPRTFGIYEKTNIFFTRARDLAAFIREASIQGRTIIFKLPKMVSCDEALLDTIKNLLQANVHCGLLSCRQYTLSYNLKQMVFQVDLT